MADCAVSPKIAHFVSASMRPSTLNDRAQYKYPNANIPMAIKAIMAAAILTGEMAKRHRFDPVPRRG